MSARTILKHVYENGGMTEYQYERIDRVLKERERPHGEWKNGVCTNCGAECFEDDYMRDIKTEFCHRCGADMRQRMEGE